MTLQWPDELKEIENANKLARAEDEYEYQRDTLEELERNESHWSGLGEWLDIAYESLHPQYQEELEQGKVLNEGGYGIVKEVEFRGLRLAQKIVKVGNFDKSQIKLIMDEGRLTKKLGKHHHVIKLVGTYWKNFNPMTQDFSNAELHILTFPVANCDLAHFLDDCEEVSNPSRCSLTDLPKCLQRLVDMGFHVSRSADELRTEIQARLKEMMGCLTKAVEWCHSQKIQHRDLKPANILVRPGKILLADFGTSRDQIATDRSNTEFLAGFTIGYAAPELMKGDAYNARHSDIYALGCVFLHIFSVIYGPNYKFDEPGQHPNRHRAREKLFTAHIESSKKSRMQLKQHPPPHPFLPSEVVQVLAPMFAEHGDKRPDIATIQMKLTAIGGPDQAYFGPCCRTHLQTTASPEPLSSPTFSLRRVSGINASTTMLKRFRSSGDNRPTSLNSEHGNETWHMAMALYTHIYSPDQPDHLGFKQGEKLQVTDIKKDWWTARTANGDEGLVPGNFFTVLHGERPSTSSRLDVKRTGSLGSGLTGIGLGRQARSSTSLIPELDSGYDRAELA